MASIPLIGDLNLQKIIMCIWSENIGVQFKIIKLYCLNLTSCTIQTILVLDFINEMHVTGYNV